MKAAFLRAVAIYLMLAAIQAVLFDFAYLAEKPFDVNDCDYWQMQPLVQENRTYDHLDTFEIPDVGAIVLVALGLICFIASDDLPIKLKD